MLNVIRTMIFCFKNTKRNKVFKVCKVHKVIKSKDKRLETFDFGQI